MKKRPPSSLRRIGVEFLAVVLVQWLLSLGLMHARILDHLLSPGSDSKIALGVITGFFLLRMFVLLFAPGWLLARLWLWWTRPGRA